MFPKSHLAQSLIHVYCPKPESSCPNDELHCPKFYCALWFISFYKFIMLFLVSLRHREVNLYITHFWHFFRLIEVKEQDECYLITHLWHLDHCIMASRARYITHNALFYFILLHYILSYTPEKFLTLVLGEIILGDLTSCFFYQ